jgi:hypothetical protein
MDPRLCSRRDQASYIESRIRVGAYSRSGEIRACYLDTGPGSVTISTCPTIRRQRRRVSAASSDVDLGRTSIAVLAVALIGGVGGARAAAALIVVIVACTAGICFDRLACTGNEPRIIQSEPGEDSGPETTIDGVPT